MTRLTPIEDQATRPSRAVPLRQPRERAAQVNTRIYQMTYGKMPAGHRPWGFAIGARSGSYWVDPMPYLEAERLAVRMAESLGETTVMVLP